MLRVTNLIGFGAGFIPSVSYLESKSSTADATTYTFTSCNLGDPSPYRHIIVLVNAGGNNSNTTLNSLTIDGVSASVDTTGRNAGTPLVAQIGYAKVNTANSTGTIEFTQSAVLSRCVIGIWYVYSRTLSIGTGVVSYASGVTSQSVSPVVAAGGFAIAGASHANTSTTGFSWTGANERYDTVPEAGNNGRYSGADTKISGTNAITATVNTNAAILVAAYPFSIT